MTITIITPACSRLSRRFAVSALSVAAALVFGPAAAQSSNANANAFKNGFAPGRILVMPRAGLSDDALDKIVKGNGGIKGRRIGQSELRIVDVPPGLEKQIVDKLSHHPQFKFAELDQLVAPDLVTNDPYLGSEWHLPKIGAPAAWDSTQGSGVTIAILDTGVDGTHPDLAPRMVPGWNFYDNNSNTADVYNHGTKVAGTAAAASDNATGVASVAGQAKIMPIRISDTSGTGSWSAVAQGLTYAADHGARVANVSYMVASSTSIQSAAQYMKNKGGLVFVSAGNTGVAVTTAPTTTMIPVSATDANDVVTSWSTYGPVVAMSAPGAGIYTTTAGGGYASVSGTSFSSPITAGVAALVMAVQPTLTSAAVENIIYTTAVDLGAAGRDVYYGYGRVNAAAAVQMAMTSVAKADTTPPSASISAPLASSTVSGLVAVNVAASDNVGVSKVELRVNGSLVATDTSSPYAFSWDSTKSANGMVGLVATAYDAAGNSSNSATVSVNVANAVVADTTPPVVSFVNPQASSSVRGSVSISVAASDNSGTSGLKDSLYIDGALVATATGGSLSYNWNTKKSGAGTHALKAVATDAAGNTGSVTQSITVQ